ncbi:MAG TPA: class I SAM-dependent methyltransferase, partial [Anaerolineales bacterium]|nr:class I SAM-dependent methyltransferase [Anaerolineales bacterium]
IFYSPDATFLDYGGGNGMFVRMMRDKGFNYYWYDKFASNQFAAGFEASQEQKFSLITAFEVFEHLLQPLEAVDEMLRYSDAFIFSTRLLPRWKIMPSEWWYFTLDTGQHVSLYSRDSLKVIAQKFNLNFSSNGISLHVLSKIAIPSLLLQALSYPPFSAILSGLLNLRRPSLLEQDYYRITGVRLDQK